MWRPLILNCIHLNTVRIYLLHGRNHCSFSPSTGHISNKISDSCLFSTFLVLGGLLYFPNLSCFYVTIIMKFFCSFFLVVLVHIVLWYHSLRHKIWIFNKWHMSVISFIFLFLSFLVLLFLLSHGVVKLKPTIV